MMNYLHPTPCRAAKRKRAQSTGPRHDDRVQHVAARPARRAPMLDRHPDERGADEQDVLAVARAVCGLHGARVLPGAVGGGARPTSSATPPTGYPV
eukprot:6775024-Prymnesium_polylepis.1